MYLPGLIIFVNDSVTLASLNTLKTDTGIQPNELVPFTPPGSTIQGLDTQLQINETIMFDEFNARVKADPNYPTVVHLNQLRILVILSDFQNTTNRNLADVVMFVKQGIASVEKCKYGSPGFSLDVQRINIFNLLYGIKHSGDSGDTVICYPCFPEPPCPGTFPPPICPPQTQTLENPRPPEHLERHKRLGLGALELYGVEAVEASQGVGEGVFGDKLDRDGDGSSGTDGEV